MWAIKGRNGSGKSTLLQLLIGYIEPTLGSITWSIDKKEIDRMDISQHITYASPSMELPMHLTLREFMHMHQTFKPFLVPLDEILERLSLPTDVRLSKFSTGMIQRVKLAQACYSRSKLVALDEPMSNLDEEGKEDEEMDKLERRLIQRKMEREALKKESDEASLARLEELNEKIAEMERIIDTTDLLARALRDHVAFVPGRAAYLDGRGGSEMRLNFSGVGEDDIREGIRRICADFPDESIAQFGPLGITLCYHRLLTHRGFVVPKRLEHFLAKPQPTWGSPMLAEVDYDDIHYFVRASERSSM